MEGAITPNVFTSEKRLSNFHRAGQGDKEGGSAASIAIDESLATRVEPALRWTTNIIEVTNAENHTIRARGPWCCFSTKSSGEVPARVPSGW